MSDTPLSPLTSEGFYKSISITRYVILMWFFVFVILGLGVYLSYIQFWNAEWLSRSGSLIVVLGIFSGMGGVIQEQWLQSQIAFQHRMAVLKIRRKMRLMQVSQEYLFNELQDLDKKFEQDSSSLHSNLKLRAGVLELSLLIVGTLFWGFGDLVMRFLLEFIK